jgi:hypothetical protein
MTALESAFDRILGFSPTYMRAPYLALSDEVLAVMAELGYHVIGASVDTKDYEFDDPGTNWRALERFLDGVNAGGTVVLAHDSHYITVEILVDNMLAEIEMRGLNGQFILLLVSTMLMLLQLLLLVNVLGIISGIGLGSLVLFRLV